MKTVNERVRDLLQLAPEESHRGCTDVVEAEANYRKLLDFAWMQVRCRHALRHVEREQEKVSVAFETLSGVMDEHWDALGGDALSILLRERGLVTERGSRFRQQWFALSEVAYARQPAAISVETMEVALHAVTSYEQMEAQNRAELMRDLAAEPAASAPPASAKRRPPDEPDPDEPDEEQSARQ